MNLHPWQMDMLKKLEGFKSSELIMYGASRGIGKSVLSQQNIDRLMREINSRPI
jgi:hypothetical protein